MNKPKMLDLFCGAGGASRGYMDAGFDVVGIDINPQPHYCGHEFYQADALSFPLDGFDVVHASPPCQGYSRTRGLARASMRHAKKDYPLLIADVRSRLEASGKPWIIENVAFSDIPDALILCGSMFGLPIRRHRWFASSHLLFSPGQCKHTDEIIGVFGNNVRGYGSLRTNKRYQQSNGRWQRREASLTLKQGQEAMGIDWMTVKELCQAIPPAYTHWIGAQLIEYIKVDSRTEVRV